MTTLNVFGERIPDAESVATAKFLACPWQFFDGVADRYPNQLLWGDFAITRVMNSGVNEALIPGQADLERAGAILEQISTEDALAESEAPPYDEVHSLFKVLRAHQLGRSRIAKVLCRKRPNLIPMLDRVVTDFLYKVGREWSIGARAGKPIWFDDAWRGWTDDDDPTVYLRMVREALSAELGTVREVRAQIALKSATGVPADAPLLRIWEATLFWYLWSR